MREFCLTEQVLQCGSQLLIEASAGTGKTTILENIVLRLLLEGIQDDKGETQDIQLPEILIVTFTEAATSELLTRVRDNIREALKLMRLPIEQLSQQSSLVAKILINYFETNKLSTASAHDISRLNYALLAFDEAAIFTIHGFCSKMLDDFAFESGMRFDLELTDNELPYLRETAEDYWRQNLYSSQAGVAAAIALSSGITIDKLVKMLGTLKNALDVKLPDDNDLNSLVVKIKLAWKNLAKFLQAPEVLAGIEANKSNFLKAPRLLLEDVLQLAKNDLEFSCDYILLVKACEELTSLCINDKLFKKKPKWQDNFLKSETDASGSDTPLFINRLFERLQQFVECCQAYAQSFSLGFVRYALKRGALQRKKNSAGVRAFDDLLENVLQVATTEPSFRNKIKKQFPVVLIDEFQDTDPVQFRIFDLLFRSNQNFLLMVGDPKQSIYQFRGADVYSYLEAARQLPAANISSLRHNFRSSQKLLDAFNDVFDGEQPFVEKKINYTKVQAGREQARLVMPQKLGDAIRPLQIVELTSEEPELSQEQAWPLAKEVVCRQVVNFLAAAQKYDNTGVPLAYFEGLDGEKRKIKASDIAVLVRSNAEAQEICTHLATYGVQAVLQRSGNIFTSDVATNLLHVLLAMAHANNPKRVLTALAGPFYYLDYQQIVDLKNSVELLEDFQTYFFNLAQSWRAKGFMTMFSQWLSSEKAMGGCSLDIRSNLLMKERGERHLTDLLQLGEILHKVAKEERLGMLELLRWLQHRVDYPEENSEYERRLESDEEAVQIMTVHKSKGLQFPIVFCANLWSYAASASLGKNAQELGILVHVEAKSGKTEQRYFFNSSKQAIGEEYKNYQREALAEHVRLIYVALTRAKNYCSLIYAPIKYSKKDKVGALSYLLQESNAGRWKKSKNIALTSAEDIMQLSAIQLDADNTTHEVVMPRQKFNFPKGYGILSFSSLVGPHTDYEQQATSKDKTSCYSEDSSNAKLPLDDFPGGAVSGECIHQIFQEIDFSLLGNDTWRSYEDLTQLINDKLIYFNRIKQSSTSPEYDAELLRRNEQIKNMLEVVLKTPLKHKFKDFCLTTISLEKCIAELEFCFPVKQEIDYKKLNHIIELQSGKPGNLSKNSAKQILQGYMNGFIDLIFEKAGRYYIVDWKTNNLGESFAAFMPPELADAMSSNGYFLQAAIYLYALDRYLRVKLKNYSFEKHMGGIFYLFVRGMGKNSSGVYYLEPEQKICNLLNDVFNLSLG